MQEAMLSCVDVTQLNYIASEDLGLLNFASTKTKTTFEITPQQLSMRRLPMAWFCEMANVVIGDNGELLEYKQLIANPKTRATWSHSYGNEIGRLSQGMPGRNTSTNTIFFIKKDQVPKERAKDVTYGLIMTLIRPERSMSQTECGWWRAAIECTILAMPEHRRPNYSPSNCYSTASYRLRTHVS